MIYRCWITKYKSILISAVIGYVGWNGSVVAMLGLPLLVRIWYMAPSRHVAFLAILTYYLVSDRGLLRGAAVFFSDPLQKPSLLTGLMIWIAPSILLALTWATLWGRRFPVCRLIATLLFISLPPIGIVGWANPITAAGAWFPGSGWCGLIAFLFFLSLLVSAVVWWWYGMMAVLTCIAIVMNATYVAPESKGWTVVNTRFHPSKDDAGEYLRMRQLLVIVDRKVAQAEPGSVIVLPEAIGGNRETNEPFWNWLGEAARRKKVTILVGAQRTVDGSMQYVNGLYSIGLEEGIVIPSRMPVPISMWMPLSRRGAVAAWGHPGVTQVHGQIMAHLVCYEQLLIWPVLRSMIESPQVLVGVTNGWWATRTSISKIQRQVVNAWGRLFVVPVVFAINE
jgi:hypothetical protein